MRRTLVGALAATLAACPKDPPRVEPRPDKPDKPDKPEVPEVPKAPEELAFAPKIDGRDLRLDPPAIDTVEAEIVDVASGDAKLRVTFAKSEKLPQILVIEHDGRRLQIRDDGKGDDDATDGVFTARAKLDLKRLAEAQERIEFDGRVRVAPRRIDKLDLERLKPGTRFPLDRSSVAASAVIPDASLVITDLAVVEDPTRTFNPCTETGAANGKWTFGHLMREMANQSATGISPESMARRWLDKWMTAQTVNGFTNIARTRIDQIIIQPWLTASGGVTLDLSKAPFKLLAIVNRVDLADNLAYGGGSAGEGRFVFGAIDRRAGGCEPIQFTVIFEYGIEATGCAGLQAWAQRWFDLQANPTGSAAYNAALESITDTFVAANAAPAKMNGSALNQLRTNEVALANFWELREFRLDPLESGFLRQVTVKRTPDIGFDRTTRLNDFLIANSAAILAETHDVPPEFPTGMPFLGAAAPVANASFFWRGAATPAITVDQRFHFSLNTCNGCHAGETATDFTHVKPAAFGTEAELSGFMTGIDVNVDGLPTPRHFDDLERRQQRMADILGRTCLAIKDLRRFKMTH